MGFPKQSVKQKIGYHIEQVVCAYLRDCGLVLLEKNYRTYSGEIDLIMRDKKTLVFVEVRYRKSDKFGGAIESIDGYKQQRIIKTAQQYLLQFGLQDKWPCRFDVVIVTGNLECPVIEWLKQAFE